MFEDLPYFLHSSRPSGFLGRLIPRLHPDLPLPEDISAWSADHCLRHAVRYGWNLPGSYVLGDRALNLFLAHTRSAPDRIDRPDRAVRYPQIVSDLIAFGVPGSSAGGEQPKFLATVFPPGQPVLVKFSPETDSKPGRRWADLLACEAIAHRVLRKHGVETPVSECIDGGGRRFLEVERFDRLPGGGRRAVLSLFAVDAEFVGSLRTWTETALALAAQRRIGPDVLRSIRRLELFGLLIGNTDMHHANLSFVVRGERLAGLSPVYDMLPMAHAPLHESLSTGPHALPDPSARHAGVWTEALRAARDFWTDVAGHDLVSPSFRAIASGTLAALDGWETLARRLPA